MWSRRVARLITILAVALLSQAPAARAALRVAAPAMHTATPGGQLRVCHHHRAHRRHEHDQIARAHASPFAPAPGRPARHRAERRAAVPQNLRRGRQGQGPRDGLALVACAVAGGMTGAPRRLDGLRPAAAGDLEGRVTSGRGPPPARALESHSPAPPGGPPAHPWSASRPGSVPAASRVLPASRAFPRPAAGHPAFAVSVAPELLPVRSHVRRPEGTAACLPTPSHGDPL